MAAHRTCDVENCTRFTVTQWVIGIAVLLMLGTQGYLIKRVDKIESALNSEIKEVVSSLNFHKDFTSDLSIRIALLERELEIE